MAKDKGDVERATSSRTDRPVPRRSSAVRAWLLAILGFTGCAALGWYYWQLWQRHGEQEEALAAAQSTANACTGDLDSTRTRADGCQADLSSCEKAREEQASRAEELASAQQKMQEDLHATSKELESLRELKIEAEKGAQAFADLKQQLKEMIDSKQVEVQRRDGRLLVQLPAEVLFASGSADLSEDGKVALIKLSAVLEKMPERKFMVAGHTDSYKPAKGSAFRNNWELSTARAVTVTELLVTAKLDPKNLVAAGYGEFAPIADNSTEKGRRQNRRIEIVLLPDILELTAFEDNKGSEQAAKGAH